MTEKKSEPLMTTLSTTEKASIRSISLSGERWKRAKGFSSNYYVSNMGRILTTRKYGANIVAVMKPAKDANGYYRTMMDGKTVKVHRIVAENWLKNPSHLRCVNHLNCDRADNRVENLEWCSTKYNAWYGTKMGNIKQPTRPANARYTDKDRDQVRKEYLEFTAGMGKTLAENMKRKEFYEMMGKRYPLVSNATIKEWATGRLKSYQQSLTILSVCEKHHSHIVSEENIVL